MTQIHITRIEGEDCYGHETSHCDAAGCNGTEHYYPTLRGSVEARARRLVEALVDKLSASCEALDKATEQVDAATEKL